ncbi:PIG-L family deacetylase [Arthrobacter sp.]|uniref:PIG-L family deacetylase n=1 Tax=Arthrobacter sp. TaxID=1667 RepID=UPI0033939D5E
MVLTAHPDDPEYGIAVAVAVRTGQGKDVAYVLATMGEAGVAGLSPREAGPLREQEQILNQRDTWARERGIRRTSR